ncbi:vasodilator-stimulated phosphoprotein [Folsomia candida]|uniref:vasodilator-stimulated phosphoprotein n=1 Tax=Folsomia candida TaxID=158441 RepID=UPI000B8FD88A|nr:vasodilator-stimulated phosphoprotein [Folsomia candida]
MSEQSIASARASVMIYDETNKKWVPSGSSSGLSKVHIYHHVVNNTYRTVGRKLNDQEVVINCSILKGLKYNQATPTFHQWRDNRQVYGLNFSSKDDAEAFAYSMMLAVDALNNATPGPPRLMNSNHTGPPPMNNHHPHPPPAHNNNNHHPSEEDMGYRTMTREDIAVITERRMSQPQQQVGAIPSLSPNTPPVLVQNQGGPPGHHRTNSAPQPPPPPPAMPLQTGGGGPPPPPPPMPNGPLSKGGDQEVGSLAAALAQAQLKKANRPQPDAISTTSTSSSSSSGSASSASLYGTLRGGVRNGIGGSDAPATPAGGTSLMDEMAKTLARRRAMCKENSAPNLPLQNGQDEEDSRPGGVGKMKESPPSPKTNQRKRTGSDTCSGIVMNGSSSNGYDSELESLKQDMLKEIRKELCKVKAEIIDAIKLELNRR